MLFPTVEFAIFFLIILAITNVLYKVNFSRKLVLLLASYVFYAFWDWRFVFLLLGSGLINFIIGYALVKINTQTPMRKILLIAAIVVNLGVLGFFKYYGFFLESLDQLLHWLNIERDLPFLGIILPVGISFFTFQGISYIVDIYNKKVTKAYSVLDVLLYISFFPQLVAGPIVRAHDFLPQLEKSPNPNQLFVTTGLLLILWGLFKKAIVANYLATELVDPVFFDPSLYGTLDVIIAVYGYAVQIYCDFSAYSDIAIGIAMLLGYSFPHNFNQPYRADSLQEFWRRWHISLSTWLRDYLYIPLGGSKFGKFITYRNLFLTMLLGGLWHGAAWNFIVWGVLHGAWLVAERANKDFQYIKFSIPKILRIIVIFHFVCLGWIFFRASSFESGSILLGQLFHWQSIQVVTPFLFTLILIGMSMHFLPKNSLVMAEKALGQCPPIIQGLIVGLIIIAIAAFGSEDVAPFIYFQF